MFAFHSQQLFCPILLHVSSSVISPSYFLVLCHTKQYLSQNLVQPTPGCQKQTKRKMKEREEKKLLKRDTEQHCGVCRWLMKHKLSHQHRTSNEQKGTAWGWVLSDFQEKKNPHIRLRLILMSLYWYHIREFANLKYLQKQ